MSSDRDLDVVVLGATGYVGRLVAGYLAGHAADSARIGLAGRSRERLANIRARLGAASSSWPLLAADVTDPASLAALARAGPAVRALAGGHRGCPLTAGAVSLAACWQVVVAPGRAAGGTPG